MLYFFFFNDTATTEIYTLSLHDALPISARDRAHADPAGEAVEPVRSDPLQRRAPADGAELPPGRRGAAGPGAGRRRRSEEHTSELQSRQYLVCRLLLEKKKNKRRSSFIS